MEVFAGHRPCETHNQLVTQDQHNAFILKKPPAFWVLILKKRRNQKQWTLCQQGGYKSSFTISAFPFPRVIFDGQHYLFCHRGAVLRAGKCIFMVLQGWWKEQLANLKARADSNTSQMRCREHYRQGCVTPACWKILFLHSADTGRGSQAFPRKGSEHCTDIKAFTLAKKIKQPSNSHICQGISGLSKQTPAQKNLKSTSPPEAASITT